MAVNLANNFESAAGAGATISIGNSGSPAGNAWDSVTIGTGATAAYTATAYQGSLAGACTSGGTPAQASCNWTTSIGTAVPRAQGRAIISPTNLTALVPIVRNRAATVQVFRVSIETTGKLTFRSGSGSGVIATSTNAMLAGGVWCIAWDVTVGSSATGVLYVYTNPASSTPTETLTANAVNFGTTNIDEANYGICAGTVSASVIVDCCGFTTAGVPGPPVQSITVSETTTISDTAARILAASRAAAETTTIVDAAARKIALGRAQAETTTVGDAAARAIALGRADAETTTVVDAAGRLIALGRAVTEITTIGDVEARTLAAGRTDPETTTVADSAVRFLAVVRSQPETTTVADAAQRSLALARADGETLGIADAAVRLLALGRTRAETTGLSDTAATNVASGRAVNETTGLSDSSTRSQAFIRPATDILLIADAAGRVTGFVRASSDAVAIADSATTNVTSGAPKPTRTSVLSDAVVASPLAAAMAGARLSTRLSGSDLYDHM